MRVIEVQSLQGFHDFVRREILPLVQPQTLFLLTGEVGAGKTELIKTVAQHFNLKDVQSPTFAFHNEYQSQNPEGGLTLHHVDLYRVKSEEDLESTGFWDLFEKENDVIFVEWSNLVMADAWPWNWRQIHIEIDKLGQTARRITLKTPEA